MSDLFLTSSIAVFICTLIQASLEMELYTNFPLVFLIPLLIAFIFVAVPCCSCRLGAKTFNRMHHIKDLQGSYIHSPHLLETSAFLFLFVDRFSRPATHLIRRADPAILQRFAPDVGADEMQDWNDEIKDSDSPLKSLRGQKQKQEVVLMRNQFKQMAPSFLEQRIHHRELLSADSLRQDAFFHTQECKRAPESSILQSGPVMASLRVPTPDALTPENSDNSVVQDIEENSSEVRSTKRRYKTRSCSPASSRKPAKEMGALQKSPRPKMIKLIPTSKVLESAAILSMQRENSEPISSVGSPSMLRLKPRKLTSQESMGIMSEQNQSYYSMAPSEIADSYYFKPAKLSVADKLKKRRIQSNMAIQGSSFTPVNGFLQIQNADFSKMMESLHECCEPSQASSFIEPRNLKEELGYSTRPNFRKKDKLNHSHNIGKMMERSFEMGSFRSEAPVRRDPHQYFGRSVEYFRVKRGSKLSPSLSPSFSPSISGTPSPVHKVSNEAIPPIGLQSPGTSPIHRQYQSRTPQTKTTSSLFNSPNKVSPPLGFAERIEVASVIKTDSQDENYEELFGAMSKTPSPEQTQQLNQLESDSLIREELIRCRTEEAGGIGPGGLDSTDSLGEELKTPGASELLARSAQDFPVRDYDEDSGSSLYWTPQPRKKSYRQSLFCPPKIKFQDSRGYSINQPSSILSSGQPSKATLQEGNAEVMFTDLDVTDCELKPYAIYRRDQLMHELLDIMYKNGKIWDGEKAVAEVGEQTNQLKQCLVALRSLEWKVRVGQYAQDFLTAVLKQKLSRFAEKCPWLHSKYSMKELEEEAPGAAHCSIRMEASLFRPRGDYCQTESKHALMKESEALLFLQGINPSNQDTFLHHSPFIAQMQDNEGQSTDSVTERTSGVLRAVESLKQEMSEVWTAPQQRTLEYPGEHFKSTLYNFKCMAQCLLFKQGIALLLLFLSYQKLEHMWDESKSNPASLMLTWGVLVVLTLALGFIFLQPLKLMLQLHLYLKCRRRGRLNGVSRFLVNGDIFEKLRSDRELVRLFEQRRRDYKLFPVALDEARSDEIENNENELKRRLHRIYALIWSDK